MQISLFRPRPRTSPKECGTQEAKVVVVLRRSVTLKSLPRFPDEGGIGKPNPGSPRSHRVTEDTPGLPL